MKFGEIKRQSKIKWSLLPIPQGESRLQKSNITEKVKFRGSRKAGKPY
jgi:hypothetical protein